jgi:LysR family cys regulon transcriptional activator
MIRWPCKLGIEIFVRARKRLVGLMPPGRAVLEAENLKRAGDPFARQSRAG